MAARWALCPRRRIQNTRPLSRPWCQASGTEPSTMSTAVPSLITPQTCGVIVEPIQGEGGVNVATAEFMQALRDRCNEVGAVLVYDEIQCGLSRTGTLWAHASLPKTAHPDILTTAKALGNGFPIGATIVSEEVARCVVTGDHGTTFRRKSACVSLGALYLLQAV